MKLTIKAFVAITGVAIASFNCWAAVSAEDASKLKSTLTPLGAEKAGNAAGTIPAWAGAPLPAAGGDGGRRTDPFAADKPLYSITAQNMGQYSQQLTDGQQAMLKRYPTYRLDVYPTRRTAVAPQWVYDNTFKNATRAKSTKNGLAVEGAYGGIPFPIPKSGSDAMWNHLLSWQGESFNLSFKTYITTSDGKRVLASDSVVKIQEPYYFKEGTPETFKKEYQLLRLITNGPAQKAGEAILVRDPTDFADLGRQSWQYLTGQRRVRKLPNALYDTPSFVTSGVSNFDEIFLFSGPMDRYDWKLVGKQEMLVPYNENRFFVPAKDDAVLMERHLNPDFVRWELHRVWVVEATLAEGKRHVMPKRRFYLDEDTWLALLADGWDAKGQLWRTFYYLNVVAPDMPGLAPGVFGHYNLQTGDWIANNVMNEKTEQIHFLPRLPETMFTPDALAGEGIR